jgi:hypothetical protein
MEIGGGIMALVVGVGFLLVVHGSLQAARHRHDHGTTTPGTVVGSRTVRNTAGSGADSFYEHPVVEFLDDSGATRRFVHSTGTRSKPATGKVVEVWYDPARPDAEPAIADDPKNVLLLVVFGVAGVVAVVVGAALLGSAGGLW